MSKTKTDQPTYGIGAVSRLTGVTTHTLRMWERRYAAVVADRSPNGRRFYHRRDVEKLSLLKALTERGTAIGTVASLSLDELRARVEQLDQMQAPSTLAPVRVAILGPSLPALLDEQSSGAQGIAVAAAGSELRRLRADLRGSQADVLLLESSVLDRSALVQIVELMQSGIAKHTVVVYSFGRSEDIKDLERRGVRLLRSPAGSDELIMAIRAADAGPKVPRRRVPRSESATISGAADSPPPLRYSKQQLSRLGRLSSSIECECPKHLADILSSLGAFEVYSQDCEDRDSEDAALHAYLHTATAHARAIMEEALARVIAVEQLEI